ncbi:hypothetical protein I4U23_009177 [Adineta vaga]|nr:hypothetical protein I4U23_009177 [Adineta vaga]
MLLFLQLILILIVPSVLTTVGVDVSQKVSQEQFECLKDNGYKFIIVRIYRNSGVVDINSAVTIRNARAAGFNHVDGYLLPCLACNDPSQQIFETIDYLKDENVHIDRLWLDVEGEWQNDTDANIQFVQDLILEIKNSSIKYGICTSKSQWITITNNVSRFSFGSPLWYMQHDRDKSFNRFQSFGGFNL